MCREVPYIGMVTIVANDYPFLKVLFIMSCAGLRCLALSRLVLSCLVLSCLVLPYLFLFCLVCSCLILSCVFVFSCLAWYVFFENVFSYGEVEALRSCQSHFHTLLSHRVLFFLFSYWPFISYDRFFQSQCLVPQPP
jgi:hypothetical protein